ncbi:MAG: twin-arginine translocase TatA/TatE family subunit [Granulosicoccaceae bacterium]|jgi:sec-independent protein translocase protein TatA
MGFGGIGPGSLILILVIVILLFGTKKLRNVGGDLGGALKSFRKAVKEGDDTEGGEKDAKLEEKEGSTIEGESVREDEKNKS